MNFVPDYLKKPSMEGHTYGELSFDSEKKKFCLRGEPILMDFAKRVFPGANVQRYDKGGGTLMFNDGRREVSDLNWLLMRYPVVVKCEGKLNRARESVIEQIQSRRTDKDLVKVQIPPEFTGELFDYQSKGASFLINNKRCVLADGMGLGKTWTSLGAVSALSKYPVLVVCQTQVQLQWQRVIGALFDVPGDYGIELFDSKFDIMRKRGEKLAPILKGQKPYKMTNSPFNIIHYGLLKWWGKSLLKKNFPVVIFDEVQELRHTGTGKYSQASFLSDNAEYVWANSGTPIFGYGKEIWSVMNAVEFHCLGSEESFTREWCTGYGEKIVEDPKALNGHLSREGLFLRRKAEDVQIELPKIARHVQDLEHDSELYDSLIDSAREKAKGYGELKFHEKGKASRFIENQSRKAAGLAKAPYAAEFIASLIEAGEVPLIYAWHHEVHDILIDRLKKYNLSIFTGRETQKKKDLALKRFMEGGAGGALLSLRSASGLDGLQHRATCCVFVELDWSPAVHSQAETRIARIGVEGRMDEVPSYYCVCRVGHDEVMLDVLGVKIGQFKGIVGDEPENEEEQRVLEEKAVARIKRLVEKLCEEGDNEVVCDVGGISDKKEIPGLSVLLRSLNDD